MGKRVDRARRRTEADRFESQRRVAAVQSSIEPAILGTLFERGLDPAKRSQLGTLYR